MALRFDLGAPWLNLLGSLGHVYGAHSYERLSSPERLREFLEHEALSPAQPEITEADLKLALELRETLRSLTLDVLHGRPPAPDAVAAFNRFLSADQPLQVTPENGTAVLPGGLRAEAPDSVAVALARVAREAARHLSGPELAHIRQCSDPACAGAFLDPTGRRRWCAADRCGVKARVRAHRARKRAE